MERADQDVIVVGAGIIGIASAEALTAAGLRVLLVDRTGICAETSSGNAGALAFSDVLPLAQKGLARQVPRWLLDPEGPLAIPPAYLPRLLPWLLRFRRAGAPDRMEASLAAQVAMMRLAESSWSAMLDRTRTRSMLREDGSLELYESDAEYAASLGGWAARQRFGITFQPVDRGGIEALQPGLSTRFVRAVFVPGWKTVSDPMLIGRAIWDHAAGHGAHFRRGTVAGITPLEAGAVVHLEDGAGLRARHVVLAAGAWSHRLAAPLGDRIPLETERGYNTTLPRSAFDVKRQLIFSRHGFVVTPLDTGLRVGGAVELGGLERAPNWRRARNMLAKTERFLPGLRTEGGREWMGYRPSLPDSLPVIGRASKTPSVLYAFGHGHLGLTQSAAAGALIAQLVTGAAPSIDLEPFSPSRF